MKFFAKILFLFVLMAYAATAGADDNSRVKGSVSGPSGNPVGDARIQVIKANDNGEIFDVARSDEHGFFKTEALPPGAYYLKVFHKDYRPVTTAGFAIDASQAVSIEIALRKFFDQVSQDDDPRNQGLRQVLRGASDRRFIFRDAPEENFPEKAPSDSFVRGGTMQIASGAPYDGEVYLIAPKAGQNGMSSNFAFTEPLNSRSRVIVSGQIDISDSSFWRIRNTYHYRPDKDHDYRISAGYGQLSGNRAGFDSTPSSAKFLPATSDIETFAFNVEGSARLLDIMAVKYGIDYSRLRYGADKSFFYPSFQILLNSVEGWNFQTSIASRRFSGDSSIILPDGEILNLAEPTLITVVDDKVSMSQVRHSEVSARRTLNRATSFEFAVYRDDINGSGLPLLITAVTPSSRRSCVIEMNDDYSSQKGLRFTAKHKVFEYLTGSVMYIYGESKEIDEETKLTTTAAIEKNPLEFMKQRYRHSVTGRLDAVIPFTQTGIIATARWNSGSPLTALDWFSDKMDIGARTADFEIRQLLPLPAALEVSGRWEFMIELRNALNQGSKTLSTTDGEVVLNRNPRSLRFGVNYSFR